MEIAKICEALVPPSLVRSTVEDVLARIKHGALVVRHCDGSESRYGDTSSPLRVEITDERFYLHCLLFGDIGFGEAYTDGWWTTPDLAETMKLLINNAQELGGMSGSDKNAGNLLKVVNKGAQLLRANTIAGSRKNIQEHYDLSNDFYALWLDSTMTYSSALWNEPNMTLEQAQRAKWRSLAESLELKKDDELLEIGTGWGGFACFAVQEYGCKVTTFTISAEQHKYAQELFIREGVADRITLHLQDYRKIQGTFDKIVSIEMMEAIGHDFLPVFFRVIEEKLRPQGLMSFQVITTPDSRYHEYRKGVDWIQKHIFPGGLLPSVGHLHEVINKVSDMHMLKFLDMGTHYAKTLNVWDKNFQLVKDKIAELGFDERFQRKWHYYLKYCEAAFITRNISVVQVTLTRPNNRKLANGAL